MNTMSRLQVEAENPPIVIDNWNSLSFSPKRTDFEPDSSLSRRAQPAPFVDYELFEVFNCRFTVCRDRGWRKIGTERKYMSQDVLSIRSARHWVPVMNILGEGGRFGTLGRVYLPVIGHFDPTDEHLFGIVSFPVYRNRNRHGHVLHVVASCKCMIHLPQKASSHT